MGWAGLGWTGRSLVPGVGLAITLFPRRPSHPRLILHNLGEQKACLREGES